MRARSVLWVVWLLVAPATLSAQAALRGVVRDSAKHAIQGVEVVIQAVDRKALSDTAGEFIIGGLAHGAHVVLVRAIGYRPILLRAYLVTNDTLAVDLRLNKAPVQLAPLEVTATSIPPGLDAFEERRLAGFGAFVDWTTLRKSEDRRLADMFREIRGVRIRYNRNGQPYLSSSRDACPMQVYLDRVPLPNPFNLDLLPSPKEITGIEVYAGSATIPPQFNGFNRGCGIILVWTRDGG